MNSQLLYHTVSKHNILPLTSRCGISCLFCSHRYNPPGVRAVFLGELDLRTIKDLVDLLDPKRKIVIGESASRLCEGEPLSHPQFGKVIELVRRRFPLTPLQITTNGIGLSRENLSTLAQSLPLELIVSLNSADPRTRRHLMGRHSADQTLWAICQLADNGIPWHASIVLMPHITGWKDIDCTLSFAAGGNARSTRLLLPGFSSLANADWQALEQIPAEIYARIDNWRKLYPQMPITLEPALVSNLRALVAGTMAESPAFGLLLSGDEIIAVNNQTPFSRADAFHSLFRLANPVLTVNREGIRKSLTLPKPARSSSGVVMDGDLDKHDYSRAIEMAGGAGRVLLLTSAWAEPLWNQAVPKNWRVQAVSSVFFGGNIAAAGLLTVQDYRLAMAQLELAEYDAILLPPVSFDETGVDLRGEDCRNLARELTIPLKWA